MPRPFSFSVSLVVHGSLLAWMAFGPAVSSLPPRSLYDIAIRPHEDRLIYYQLSDRLPDITPPHVAADHRPPRASRKFPQNIVAAERDDRRPPQLIWSPAPEIPTPKGLPLPNVVAAAPPRSVRQFTPPTPTPKPAAAPVLPDAPQALVARTAPAAAVLPALDRPAALPFQAPQPPRVQVAAVVLPALPEVLQAAPAAPSLAPLSQLPHGFVAPPKPAIPAPAPVVLPAAPQAVSAADAGNPQAALAIVGLAPAKLPQMPAPPASHEAGFSAGPKLNPTGGQSGPGPDGLQVPGLMVTGGPKEDHTVSVARAAAPPAPPVPEAHTAPVGAVPVAAVPVHPATRVSNAPDPRLFGRAVYSMAIQMPNLTSYSGSWLVWFAESDVSPGGPAVEVEAPQAVRKVDPRYVASAIQERVEGKVRLWAVIGKDGHVGSISLLSHLDERLDQSAVEALSKWIFLPARYGGIPVEVDAVFEVPFKLAPKPPRR